MTFAVFFEQYLRDEGISEQEVWEMSLSEYNHLKREAMKYYRKEHTEKRFVISAVSKYDDFVWNYNQIFRQKEDAENFAKEVRQEKGNEYLVTVNEIEVIC